MKTLILCPHGPAKPIRICRQHGAIHSWPEWSRVLPDCWVAWGNTIDDAAIGEMADRELIVIIGGSMALDLLRGFRERLPHARICAMQDANTAWETSNEAAACRVERLTRLMQFYRRVDGILCATRNGMAWYEAFGPTAYVGLPYPMEWASYALPVGERRPRTIAIGGQYRASRGVLLSLRIAAELDYGVIVQGDRAGEVKALCADLGIESERYPLTGQGDWLKIVRHARLGLYMDQMGSVGRFARDCAALRIPCVMSARTDFGCTIGEPGFHEERWWRVQDPDYRVGDVVRAVERVEANWTMVADWQADVLREFDAERSLGRWNRALTTLGLT